MKKTMFFIIFFILFATISNSESNFVMVDKKVESALETDEEVSVIVMLKDDYSSLKRIKSLEKKGSLKLKKEMIKKQQENVLSGLNIGPIKNDLLEKKSLKKIKELDEIEQTKIKPEFKIKHRYSTVNSFSGKISKEGLEKLKNNLDVEAVYFNGEKHVILDVSVPLINATKTWSVIYNNTNITGAGETVCVIDTGVDFTHPNLGNCTNATFLAGNCSKVIAGYDYVNSDNNPMDDHSHGTHVAGIVASENETYKGVAPDAKVVALKVCNSAGSCSEDDINAGIDWCVNNASKYNISVITMSLGDCTNHSTYCNSDNAASHINTAVGQSIIVTISAGNGPTSGCASSGITNTDGPSSPACVENATAVGAVDDNDAINYQRGALFELLAPGLGIISTKYPNGGFVSSSGTSMSAPHVAGAAALLHQFVRLQNGTNLTSQEIKNALNSTGKTIDDSSGSGYNFSRINIYAAILSLDSTAPTINITYPDNNSKTNTTWVFINITSNEVLSSAILEFNNTNQTMNGSALKWYFNKTNLSRTSYTYKVYGNDSAGNIGVSETRAININNTSPSAPTLNLPLNNSYTNVNFTLLNWTAFDDDNDTLTCYVYGDNTTSPSNLINTTTNIENGTPSLYNWSGLNETTYYWKVKCDDNLVNSSFSSLFNFTIDLTYPKIEFAGGTKANNSYNESNWIYINISVTETNFNNITFILYNSSSLVNETNYTTAVYNINFTNLNDDSYYYNVTIRDKVGKTNSTKTRKITIDTIIPTTNVSFTSADDYDDDGNIELNWTDDLVELYSKNLTITYRILRSTTKINSTNIANAELISNTTTNTTKFYEDNTTLHSITYFYTIVTIDSFNRFNDSVFSVVLNATANDTIMTKTATNVNVTGSGATATIRWTNITEDANGNADFFGNTIEIWRGTSVNTSKTLVNYSNSGFSLLNTITGNANSTTDSVTSSGTYHYVVAVYDDAGSYNRTIVTGTGGNYGNTSLTYTAPTVSSTGGGSGGGGGGGTATIASEGVSASKMWSVLTKGTSTMKISKTAIGITELTLNMKNQVTNAEVTITKLDERPSAISETPREEVYQYLKIEKKEIKDADIKNVKIKFRVTKSWLTTKGINEGDVVLNKYTTKWIKLSTKKISSDKTYVTYEATTSGFSYFAITGKKSEIKVAKEVIEEDITKEEKQEIKDEPEKEIKEEKKRFSFKFVFIGIVFLTFIIISFFILRSESMLVLRAKRRHRKARKHHHKARRHHSKKLHHKARKHHISAAIHHRRAVKHYLKTKKAEHIEKARHHERAAKKHIEAIKHIDAGKFSEIEGVDRELEEIDRKLSE